MRSIPVSERPMKKIAIIGASGYTGGELLRILAGHPGMDVRVITSREHQGKPLGEVFPHLRGYNDLVFEAPDYPVIRGRVDAAFTALPHQASIQAVAELATSDIPIVDLSADFRFADADVYAAHYAVHSHPHLLAKSVYGLPEVYRDAIRGSRIVGNPGCYPTGAIIGLYPLLSETAVDPAHIIIDAKSGVSGAGRGPSLSTLYTEISEGLHAYKVGSHRHAPEIEERLSDIARTRVGITFTPHLIPMNRGILSTIYTTASRTADPREIRMIFSDYYEKEPFIRLLPDGVFPDTAWVRGSNFVDIGLFTDPDTRRIIVITAIDNLVKGAAGQAIQNMNLLLDFEETTGITAPPIFP
jgi:N-acetyl-gamma-glutamyl-phosphate reductase